MPLWLPWRAKAQQVPGAIPIVVTPPLSIAASQARALGPRTNRLTYGLVGAALGTQTFGAGAGGTWLVAFAMEDDAVAFRFWMGSSLANIATTVAVGAASFCPSTTFGDYINPTGGGSWKSCTFNNAGADSDVVDPAGSTRTATIPVPIADPETGSTHTYEPFWSDWISVTPLAPASGNIRIGMLRVWLLGGQTYCQPGVPSGSEQPNWLNIGTSNAQWQANQANCWTRNPAINQGRDYSIIQVAGDHATTPDVVPVANVGPNGTSPVLGFQYQTRSRGLTVLLTGDSIEAATTSGGTNGFINQACMALSTPQFPIVQCDTSIAGLTYLDYGPQFRWMMNQHPGAVTVQGFSRNGWDGTYAGWATQFANIMQTANRAFAWGAVVIITTGCPAALGGAVSTYNASVYPELKAMGAAGFIVCDTAAAVCTQTSPGVFDGTYLPGMSNDGVHPNDEGNKAESLVLRPLLANADRN